MSHVYGPHRAEDTPVTVTVKGRFGEDVKVPYPAALAEQRAQINRLAAGRPDVNPVTSARGGRA